MELYAAAFDRGEQFKNAVIEAELDDQKPPGRRLNAALVSSSFYPL